MIGWAVGTWGFVLSIVAILVAGASVVYTKRQAEHAGTVADIETERRAEERADRARKAELDTVADVRVVVNLQGRTVLVENHGPAEASEIHLTERSGEVLIGGGRTGGRLKAGDTFTAMASFTLGTRFPVVFDITWTDGRDGKQTAVYTFSP